MTNIGVRPTVGSEGPLAETWISDFQGDLYGRNVPVTLVKFLRPERKFDSVEALQSGSCWTGRRPAVPSSAKLRGFPGENRGREVRAVLFDFDDTLQGSGRCIFCSTVISFSISFPALPPAERERRRQSAAPEQRRVCELYRLFSVPVRGWGWKDAPPVGDIYREFQFRFPDYVSLLPDAEPVLQELRRRGFKVGVITNGLPSAEPEAGRQRTAAAAGYCRGVGDENVHKPDPEYSAAQRPG